jgi:hypothetical protein
MTKLLHEQPKRYFDRSWPNLYAGTTILSMLERLGNAFPLKHKKLFSEKANE